MNKKVLLLLAVSSVTLMSFGAVIASSNISRLDYADATDPSHEFTLTKDNLTDNYYDGDFYHKYEITGQSKSYGSFTSDPTDTFAFGYDNSSDTGNGVKFNQDGFILSAYTAGTGYAGYGYFKFKFIFKGINYIDKARFVIDQDGNESTVNCTIDGYTVVGEYGNDSGYKVLSLKSIYIKYIC